MIVTREDIRQVVYAKVEALRASFTDYPLKVVYTNGSTLNASEQTNPWLAVSIVYMDGEQIGLGKRPNYRSMGNLMLEAKDRPGVGTARLNRLLEHFFRPLQMSDQLLPLRTYAAKLASGGVIDGWASEAAAIPFWYDTST